MEAARRCVLSAYSGPGRFSGTSPKIPGSRPASPFLIWSQFRSTSPADVDLDLAEDVRVPVHELGVHVLGDLGQRAGAALLEQQREEVDLEQHVAELVEQLRVVTRLRGGGELVRLPDRVRDDRALVLLAVPRALAPQLPGQLVKPRDRVSRSGGSIAKARGRLNDEAPPGGGASRKLELLA